MIADIVFEDIEYLYANEEKTNKSNFFRHHHTQYEVLFIVRGTGTFFIEDQAYSFTDNTVIIIPPGSYHILRNAPDTDYERFVLNFAPELFPSELTSGEDNICKCADDEIVSLFDKIRDYSERFPPELFYRLLRSFLTEFLIIFYSGNNKTLEREDIPPLIRNAMTFINNNITQPLDIDLIANSLYVSKSHLNHSFHKVLNTGIMQYVRIKKMCAAREYLKSGNSAEQTATMLGYRNYITFLRNYQTEFKENPTVRTYKKNKDRTRR